MRQSRRIRTMGTVIDVLVVSNDPDKYLDIAENRLYEYEHRFSANDDSSELMQVNHNAGIQPVVVNDKLFSLIAEGKRHSTEVNSFLNIAIGPLIQTWRIGFSDANKPSDDEIKQQLLKISPHNIVLNEENCSVFLTESGMKIDLGALAKGYIADLIIEELQQLGAEAGLINMGGTIRTFGETEREDRKWYIDIKNPHEENQPLPFLIRIDEMSVVTSGIYERTLTIDGVEYHHIFNSQTGYPVQSDVESITIISKLAVDGEIWTTRLFGFSSEEMITQINQVPHIEGIVLTKDGQVLFSGSVHEYLLM